MLSQRNKQKVPIFRDFLFVSFSVKGRFYKPKTKFSLTIKFRSSLFKGLRGRGRGVLVALRRARNLYFGVFFLIAFSFAPDFAKEKANGDLIFPLAVDGTLGFSL